LVLATVAVVLAGCGWSRPRFDSANTGHNPLETVISAANVDQLSRKFVAASSTPGAIPEFVVSRGHLYVSGAPIRAYDASGHQGCTTDVPRRCTPQWSLDVFGFGEPDVIGAALYRGLNAYDADGNVNCSGVPKVCRQVWQEARGSRPFGPTNPDALHFSYRPIIHPHGGEEMRLNAYPTPCDPEPANCPLLWDADGGLGSSPGDGIVDEPAVSGGRVFASYAPLPGRAATFRAFDATTGSGPRLWTATLDGVNGVGIAASDGVVVIGVETLSGARLEAFDAAGSTNCSGVPKTCRPIWVSDAWTGLGGDAPPAIANGRVYRSVGSQLAAYDLHGSANCSGAPKVCTPLWTADAGAGVRAPAVANGLVYVSTANGFVQAYDAAGSIGCSGTPRVCGPLWNAGAGRSVGPVEVTGGLVYVGTIDGEVHAFGL
jgi:hypothetical protein